MVACWKGGHIQKINPPQKKKKMSGQKIQVPKMEVMLVMYQNKAVLVDEDSLTLSLTSIQVKFSVRIPRNLPETFV